MSARKHIPWWLKLGAKLALSRLPVDHSIWRCLALFRLGRMDDPDYSYRIFTKHKSFVRLKPGFVSLELGPGDSLSSAIIGYAHGASSSYLVDIDDFAVKDIDIYKPLLHLLDQRGLNVNALMSLSSIEEILECCSSKYLTSGLYSLTLIPSGTVDFLWSNAVLEHIKLSEFDHLLKETRRILRSDGVCAHTVDLKDHLADGLNSLRFPESIWESDIFVKSGFYTNRIRYSDMINRFEAAGFRVETVAGLTRWKSLPIRKSGLSKPFRAMTNEELSISEFSVILR